MAGATNVEKSLKSMGNEVEHPNLLKFCLKIGPSTLACRMELPQHGPQPPRLIKDQPQHREALSPAAIQAFKDVQAVAYWYRP